MAKNPFRISNGFGFVEVVVVFFFFESAIVVMAVALFSGLLLVVCVAKCAKERVQRCVYTMIQAFYHVGVLAGKLFLWNFFCGKFGR